MPRDHGSDTSSCLVVPIAWRDPAEAFLAWARDPHVAWLDSQGPADGRSRYAYLAVEPFEVVRVGTGGESPFEALDARLRRWRFAWPGAPVPFIGGAVGFIGYEAGCALEQVGRSGGGAMPDSSFGFYDVVLAFDRLQREAWLLSSGMPELEPSARRGRASARAEAVLARLARGAPGLPAPPSLTWRAETPLSVHQARVARTIAYIEAGDICQANITARFLAPLPALEPASIHLALRAANQAPYGAYLACGEGVAIASVSPERFLGLTAERDIEARPIKGTRPRGQTPVEDSALAGDLLGSAKDRAENLMIVDLLRHDIGRVAEIGSVRVPELAVLETFPRIHHLVSSVRGTLAPGRNAVDLLLAAFPGGSVTGAPKRRAMQIIHELEPAPRGPYCGAVAWLGFDGAMDSSIAIRTLAITPGQVVAQAGGGIVADSDPAAEVEEMMVKIRPLLRALGPWRD